MTTALGFGNLPFLVERASNWSIVERLFERHHVPLAVIDNPHHRIPLAAMIGLFEDAGEIVGDRAFGLRVGMQMNHTGFGIWARYVAAAATLAEALGRSRETIHFHQPGARISLATFERHTVWRYHRPAASVGAGMHHSDHVLPPMIDLVRSYLGQHWNPAWVELDYPDRQHSPILADILQADVMFGRPTTGIAIASDQLLAKTRSKLPIRKVVTLADLGAYYHWRANYGFAGAVRDAITLRLLDGKVDLEGAARLLDMGPRTLQRALNAEGISYKEMLKSARCERALLLLRNTNADIGQIAIALGYNDFANFTRAFRQWTGLPPSVARSARNTGESLEPKL